jgi:hypothetical protein
MAGESVTPEQGEVGADALLAELDRLPDWLEALTPLGREKNAYLKDWGNRPQTKEQIRAEILAGRCHAVGLICGPVSGLMVLDHDGASADAPLQKMMGSEVLPPTWINGSGRRGRWAAVFRVPEEFWPSLKGKVVRETGALSPDNGKAEALELRWTGHQSALIGHHPMPNCGYSWFPDRSPSDLPDPAVAPLPLIEALIEEQEQPEPLPLLEAPPVASGLRLPLLEFTSKETRVFVETGGTPGQWNDDQLTHALDLIGTDRWIQQQGHTAEPTARQAFADHIAAAIQKDRSFDKRKAWQRFEGGLDRSPSPSTPEATLQDRLSYHQRQAQQKPTSSSPKGAATASPGDVAQPRILPPPPSYQELLHGCLLAIRAGDVDQEMRLRASIISEFRRSDAQVTAALFRLLTEQETGMPAGSSAGCEALNLDLIEGLDPLIDGFIPANDLTLMYGSKGAGKTAAGLAVSFAVVEGTGLLDHDKPADAGPALFIASDSGAAPLVSAMQDMGLMDHKAIRPDPDQRFYVWAHDAGQRMTAWCADVPGVVRLLQFVVERRVRLVVIDSAKAICSKAGINYLDNDSVNALLTFLKEVICPHAAVVILNHDGTEKGAHAGAKAWAEIPSVVHNIMQIADAPEERLWRVVKNRMGGLREFRYRIGDDGRLEIVQGVERIGDARKAILQILREALERGIGTVSSRELAQEIDQRFGLARKTTANSLTRMTRGKNPEIVRAGHGRYRLAPRLADRLRARMTNLSVSRELTPSDPSQGLGSEKFPTPRKLQEQKPETDCSTADLSEVQKVPISDQLGTSQPETVASKVPEGTRGNFSRELSDPSDASGSGAEVPEVPAFSGIPRVRAREATLPTTATDWVRLALQQAEASPRDPGALEVVEAYTAAAGVALTKTQITAALTRLVAEEPGDDLPLLAS